MDIVCVRTYNHASSPHTYMSAESLNSSENVTVIECQKQHDFTLKQCFYTHTFRLAKGWMFLLTLLDLIVVCNGIEIVYGLFEKAQNDCF
jgi:hypothetical protein